MYAAINARHREAIRELTAPDIVFATTVVEVEEVAGHVLP
jgi:hypothetical protein